MNYKDLWVTVPTYWGDYGTEDNPPCIDFDHPTSLGGKETLTRTLDSLCEIPGDFNLLIVLAVTHEEYFLEVKKQVEGILSPFLSRKEIYLVTSLDLEQINNYLENPLLKMDSYGNIRNVQLFVPYIMGARYVIGIDDDEIIEDKDYLVKAITEIDRNENIGGMAGPYYDREGDFRLNGAEDLKEEKNIFIKKNFYINEALKNVMKNKISPIQSSVAFGGNMIFKRATIARVCHDPYIPRGEDYDYVINAMMEGISFYFYKEIGIVHLPPDSTGSQAGDNVRKLKADIRRFIYMYEKHRRMERSFPRKEFDIKILNPYPGVFIDPKINLPEQGVDALSKKYPDYMNKEEIRAFIEETVTISKVKAKEYYEYQKIWEKELSRSEFDKRIITLLEQLKFKG